MEVAAVEGEGLTEVSGLGEGHKGGIGQFHRMVAVALHQLSHPLGGRVLGLGKPPAPAQEQPPQVRLSKPSTAPSRYLASVNAGQVVSMGPWSDEQGSPVAWRGFRPPPAAQAPEKRGSLDHRCGG